MATQPISAKVTAVVRMALEERGLTQEWLSDETGIPMRTMARRLHKINPSSFPLDEVEAIATALGSDLVSLLTAARELQPILAAAS
ncbi:helix-turn-helix domain-containing protein [Microbacterium galbinum]|uniref:helix-turn-helix domain-containing protein n=1 Tax=Microbacterium galbinum TaxID=2851646 RepID=UPI001FFC46AB|nr:helix-turn-helix domain-containing protein [Microbacterium galbinum]MCK2031231.1 helix-turn-helix transcriptional regulator [Microbacterium galbinum]